MPLLASIHDAWTFENVWAFNRMTRAAQVPFFGDVIAAMVLRWKARKADVVVVNGAEYAWPFLLSRTGRRRTIVCWHGTRFAEVPALVDRMSVAVRVYWFLENVLQRIACSAHRHIAVGDHVVDEIRTGYGCSKSITVIVNGADSPPPSNVALPVDRSGRPLRMLWVGTNARKKGLDLAIAGCSLARSHGRDVELTVAGIASGRYQFADVAWIRVAGVVDKSEMAAMYANADAYLATTRYEACSMALLEAFAAGLPVIGSPIVKWMLGKAGIAIESYDPAAVARAIEQSDPHEKRLELARHALEQLKRFDWHRSAQGYISVIGDVLSDARGVGGSPL